jgi:hypothetical protein
MSKTPTGSIKFGDAPVASPIVITIRPEKARATPDILREVTRSCKNTAESSIAKTAWRLIRTDPAVADMKLNE